MTIAELANKYGVKRQTVHLWLIKAGIVPNFVGDIVDPKRRGVMCLLDDGQVERLESYLNNRPK